MPASLDAGTVAAASVDDGFHWELCDCAGGPTLAGDGIASFVETSSRFKRVWFWDEQASLHSLAVYLITNERLKPYTAFYAHENSIVSISIASKAFKDYLYPIGIAARHKTKYRSFSASTEVYPSGDDSAEALRDQLCALRMSELDITVWSQYVRALAVQTLPSLGFKSARSLGTDYVGREPVAAGLAGLRTEYTGRVVTGVDVWDVSSLYPAILAYMPMPQGHGVDLLSEAEGYLLAQCITGERSQVPLNPCGCDLWVAAYALEDGEVQYITSVEWDYLFHSGKWTGAVAVLELTGYFSYVGVFKEFIERLYSNKQDDVVHRRLYKSAMNSFIGSFSMRPSKRIYNVVPDAERGVRVVLDREEDRDPGSLNLWYAFITAYGRVLLRNALDRCGTDAIYWDTDSVHTRSGTLAPGDLEGVVPRTDGFGDLGQWTLREEGADIFYSTVRCYAVRRDGDVADLTMAGLRIAPEQWVDGPNTASWVFVTGSDHLHNVETARSGARLRYFYSRYEYYNRSYKRRKLSELRPCPLCRNSMKHTGGSPLRFIIG